MTHEVGRDSKLSNSNCQEDIENVGSVVVMICLFDPLIKSKAKFDRSIRSCPIVAVLFAAHKFA
jgi:hypothetical protein